MIHFIETEKESSKETFFFKSDRERNIIRHSEQNITLELSKRRITFYEKVGETLFILETLTSATFRSPLL